nr:hypothetical protein [Morchella crassipes]
MMSHVHQNQKKVWFIVFGIKTSVKNALSEYASFQYYCSEHSNSVSLSVGGEMHLPPPSWVTLRNPWTHGGPPPGGLQGGLGGRYCKVPSCHQPTPNSIQSNYHIYCSEHAKLYGNSLNNYQQAKEQERISQQKAQAQATEQTRLKSLVKANTSVSGEIAEVARFSTDWNQNLATVVNSNGNYRVFLLVKKSDYEAERYERQYLQEVPTYIPTDSCRIM